MPVNRTDNSAIARTQPRHKLVTFDASKLPPEIGVLTVRNGDTLTKIAKRLGVPLDVLEQANPGVCTPDRQYGDLIFPGDQIIVPAQLLQQAGGGAPTGAPAGANPQQWKLPPAGAEGAQQVAQAAATKRQAAVGNAQALKAAQGSGAAAAAGAAGGVEIQREGAMTPAEQLIESTQAAAKMRAEGAGAFADHVDEAVKTQNFKQLAVIDAVVNEAMKQTNGDLVAAAKLAGAALTMQKAAEKLPPAVKRFEANLTLNAPSAAAERTAREILDVGSKEGFDKFWKQQQPSLKLLDDTVTRLTPGGSVTGDSGALQAAIAKALKAQNPEAELDILALTARKNFIGMSTTGELAFKLTTRTKPVTLPDRIELVDAEMQALGFTSTAGPNDPPPPAMLVKDSNENHALTGTATPGSHVLVWVGGQMDEVATDAKGRWVLPLPMDRDFGAHPEIMVAEKREELYIVNPDGANAGDLKGLNPEALEKKIASFKGPTLDGTLRKVSVEGKDQLVRVAMDGVMKGQKSAVGMDVSIAPGEALTNRTFNFTKANINAMHGVGFTTLALDNPGPSPWSLDKIDANTAAAQAKVFTAFGLDPSQVDTADMVRESTKKLKELHERFGGSEELQVTTIPVVIDSPNGQSYPVPVFRVESNTGPIFVDTFGREYTSWDKFLKKNTLPPDSIMTTPPNGELKLDATGKPLMETQNTPDTVDTPLEQTMYWGQYVLMVAGMGTGIGMIGGTILRANQLISAYKMAQMGMMMQKSMQGFAALSLGSAGWQAKDRIEHGQTMLSFSDAGARQVYWGLAFGAMLPAIRTMAKGAKTAVGAYSAGTAMFVGQTSMLAGSVDEAIMMHQNWDSPDLRLGDKAMFLANLGILPGFMITGGLRGMFSPKFMRQQAQATLRVPEALNTKLKAIAEADHTPGGIRSPEHAFTQKEAALLEAKLDGLIGMKEAHEARMMFRDVFPTGITNEQLVAYRAIKSKLFDYKGNIHGPTQLTPQEIQILSQVSMAPAWQVLPPPDRMPERMNELLFNTAGDGKTVRPKDALDGQMRGWFKTKFKAILNKPKGLTPERIEELKALQKKFDKNEPLDTNDAVNLAKVMAANDYAGLVKVPGEVVVPGQIGQFGAPGPRLEADKVPEVVAKLKEYLAHMPKKGLSEDFVESVRSLEKRLIRNEPLTERDVAFITLLMNGSLKTGPGNGAQPGSLAAVSEGNIHFAKSEPARKIYPEGSDRHTGKEILKNEMDYAQANVLLRRELAGLEPHEGARKDFLSAMMVKLSKNEKLNYAEEAELLIAHKFNVEGLARMPSVEAQQAELLKAVDAFLAGKELTRDQNAQIARLLIGTAHQANEAGAQGDVGHLLSMIGKLREGKRFDAAEETLFRKLVRIEGPVSAKAETAAPSVAASAIKPEGEATLPAEQFFTESHIREATKVIGQELQLLQRGDGRHELLVGVLRKIKLKQPLNFEEQAELIAAANFTGIGAAKMPSVTEQVTALGSRLDALFTTKAARLDGYDRAVAGRLLIQAARRSSSAGHAAQAQQLMTMIEKLVQFTPLNAFKPAEQLLLRTIVGMPAGSAPKPAPVAERPAASTAQVPPTKPVAAANQPAVRDLMPSTHDALRRAATNPASGPKAPTTSKVISKASDVIGNDSALTAAVLKRIDGAAKSADAKKKATYRALSVAITNKTPLSVDQLAELGVLTYFTKKTGKAAGTVPTKTMWSELESRLQSGKELAGLDRALAVKLLADGKRQLTDPAAIRPYDEVTAKLMQGKQLNAKEQTFLTDLAKEAAAR